MFSKSPLPATLAFVLLIASIGVAPAVARAQRAVGPTPPRLAFIDGEVSFWRPGADDWTPAQVNTALAAGDYLYAGNAANLEVEIGPRAFVRAGSETQLGIASLETGYLQLQVTSGHAAVDLERLREGERVEVDTPNGAFIIDRAGYYRVDVDDSTTFTTSRGGRATMIPAGGEATQIRENRQVVLEGTDTATVASSRAPDPDGWDRWNHDRTARLGEQPRSVQYVSPDVTGADDLDRYGSWRDTRRYGHVWVPYDVSPDWAPYSTGRWVWDPYYGWTWVDYAPWGWAPYHYGRWCWVDGFWGWAPGPVVAAPVYAPALVAFFGPHVGVSVNIGVGFPFVSWVALGFGEPVIPWWGPVGFVGRPFWGGWGGPRVVNNVVINNTRIVNVTNINTFQNLNARNAVLGAHRDQFGRGAAQHVRLTADQTRQLQPVRGALEVKPVAASLTPGTGSARRPPDRIQRRQVVATRPPQDHARRLEAAGLPPSRTVEVAKPRILQPWAGRRGEPHMPPKERGTEKGIEGGVRRGIEGGVGRGIEGGIERGIEGGMGRGTESGAGRGIERAAPPAPKGRRGERLAPSSELGGVPPAPRGERHVPPRERGTEKRIEGGVGRGIEGGVGRGIEPGAGRGIERAAPPAPKGRRGEPSAPSSGLGDVAPAPRGERHMQVVPDKGPPRQPPHERHRGPAIAPPGPAGQPQTLAPSSPFEPPLAEGRQSGASLPPRSSMGRPPSGSAPSSASRSSFMGRPDFSNRPAVPAVRSGRSSSAGR